MKLKVMAVFDQAAKAFHNPFVVATEEIGVRQFARVMREQPAHDFVRYADQHNLYVLGSFDNETGVISQVEQRSLGSLQVIVNQHELTLEEKD